MATSSNPVAPAAPSRDAINTLVPVAVGDVRITSGLWAHVQQLNADAILPHCDASLERVGWVDNFRAAVRGTLASDRVGRLFTDSEIYKTMEAQAWEVARTGDPALGDRLTEYVELLEQVQEDDGYLNTYYGYEGGPERWSDMEWGHELYCAGHLLQAAVAAGRTQAPLARELVGVACRLADMICDELGPDGRQTLCGHPEIETALVELFRLTGEVRYRDQAALFVQRRGHQVLADTMYKGRDYYQDNVPVRDAEVLVGHAVRALYLAAGAVDVAVETGDVELLEAVRRQYDRTLARRTYLTGGMGSNHHGETYGDDFELPSERAYAETCAAIASVHLAWRLLLATGDERYADVIERTLINSVLSSPSLDGREFFYVNALQRRAPGRDPEPGVPSLRRTDGRRAAWFTTSCCPTNVARTISSLSGYVATTDDEGVQLHQYVDGDLELGFGDGRRVRLVVSGGYPLAGEVHVRVEETDDLPWTLGLRVPAWAEGTTLEVPGAGPAGATAGRSSTRRVWQVGDAVVLRVPTGPRLVTADPRIDDVRGCVAIERGPFVYALESPDHPGLDLDLVRIDAAEALAEIEADTSLGDVVAVRAIGRAASPPDDAWPYGGATQRTEVQVDLTFIPYYLWANRGSSTMRVWVPRTDVPTVLAATATITTEEHAPA